MSKLEMSSLDKLVQYKRDRKKTVKRILIVTMIVSILIFVSFATFFGVGYDNMVWYGQIIVIFLPLVFVICHCALVSYNYESLMQVFKKRAIVVLIGTILLIPFMGMHAELQLYPSWVGMIVVAAKSSFDLILMYSMYRTVDRLTQHQVEQCKSKDYYKDQIHVHNIDKVYGMRYTQWIFLAAIAISASFLARQHLAISIGVGVAITFIWTCVDARKYKLLFIKTSSVYKALLVHIPIFGGVAALYALNWWHNLGNTEYTEVNGFYVAVLVMSMIGYFGLNLRINTAILRTKERLHQHKTATL